MTRTPLFYPFCLLVLVVLIDAASWVAFPQPAGYTGDESTASLISPCGNDAAGYPSATSIRFGLLQLELAKNSTVAGYSLSIALNQTDFAITRPFYTCGQSTDCSLSLSWNERSVVIPWSGAAIIQYQATSEGQSWFNCFTVDVESGPINSSTVIELTNSSVSFALSVQPKNFVLIQSNFLYSIETTSDNSKLELNYANSDLRYFETLLSNVGTSTESTAIAKVEALNVTADHKVNVTYLNPVIINPSNPSASITTDFTILLLQRNDGGLVGLQSVNIAGTYTYNALYESPDSRTLRSDSVFAPTSTQCFNVEGNDQYFLIRNGGGEVRVTLDTTRPCADSFYPYFPTQTHFVIYIVLLAIGIFFSLVFFNPCFQDLMRKGQVYDGEVTMWEMEVHYTKTTTKTIDVASGRTIDKKPSTSITSCDCTVEVDYGGARESFNGCCLCCFSKLRVLAYPDRLNCCPMLYYKGWMGYIFSCIFGVGPIFASGIIAFINMGLLGELEEHGGAALQFFLGLISIGLAGVFVIPWWKIPRCRK